MSPLVSIVTICYNAAKELPSTMESVLAQDMKNFEYIIQDGNSTDSTPEIVRGYQDKFSKKGIRLIYNRERDGGIYDAMNKAVESCNGEYINFMNAGDCFYSASVLSQIFENSSNAEIFQGQFDSHMSPTIIYGDCAEYEYGRYSLFQKNLDLIEEVMPFSHQSVFARRDFLITHPFRLEYRYSADYDFLLTAHDLGESFADSGVIVCITNKDGVSSVNYHDMLLESAQILKNHGKYHHSEDELKQIERVLRLKQFVLDNFPVFIKKAIRGLQIKKRGQELNAVVPPWHNI